MRSRGDLSQSEVARAIGVSPATIWRWESGDRRPQGEAAVRWVRFLHSLERSVETRTA
jgi:DNA-binding transcriptional regulator YiaG